MGTETDMTREFHRRIGRRTWLSGRAPSKSSALRQTMPTKMLVLNPAKRARSGSNPHRIWRLFALFDAVLHGDSAPELEQWPGKRWGMGVIKSGRRDGRGLARQDRKRGFSATRETGPHPLRIHATSSSLHRPIAACFPACDSSQPADDGS